jgi:hypothetical protein
VPFRRFNLTPEQIEPMREAFNTVCQALDLMEGPERDLIAIKIMEIAATGELDPGRICAQMMERMKDPALV